MSISTVALLDDLKLVRRGAALNATDVGAHVGPALSEAAGITPNDSNWVVRQKLREWLGERVEQLPKEFRRFVNAALALTPAYEAGLLNERVRIVAQEIDRNTRTVIRRMDEALVMLAEAAAPTTHAPLASSVNDWYVDDFEAVLRLDSSAPACFERRRIVATRDGLDKLAVSITIPKAEPADARPKVDIAAVFGVRVLEKKHVTASRFQFTLKLPRALRAGESTEYGVVLRLPEGQPMSPHYTFIPERRAERFDVRVCFPPDRLPARVWLVTSAFNRDIDDQTFADEVLVPDAVGEVRATFEDLKPGFGYGVQWTDAGA